MAGAATHWLCVYLYVLPGAAEHAPAVPGRDDLRNTVAGLRDAYLSTSVSDLVDRQLRERLRTLGD